MTARRKDDPERFVEKTREAIASYPQMAKTPVRDEVGDDLAERARSIFWYHTIELPGITTEGMFDHRPLLPHYGIPDDLSGKRVLDVGTWDGFWAFEFERRGGQVVAIDVEGLHQVDIPQRYRQALESASLKQYYSHGFEMARSALASKVDRRALNLYDLGPEKVGRFDLVHMGDLLLHLEYPTKALRAVRSVTEGMAIISSPFEPNLGSDAVRYLGGWTNSVWWLPSLDAAAQMIFDAGFGSVDLHATYELQGPVPGGGSWRALFIARP